MCLEVPAPLALRSKANAAPTPCRWLPRARVPTPQAANATILSSPALREEFVAGVAHSLPLSRSHLIVYLNPLHLRDTESAVEVAKKSLVSTQFISFFRRIHSAPFKLPNSQFRTAKSRLPLLQTVNDLVRIGSPSKSITPAHRIASSTAPFACLYPFLSILLPAK